MRTMFMLTISVAVWLGPSGQSDANEWTIRLDLNGQQVEGTPLKWSAHAVKLLGRDGHLWEFSPAEAKNYRKQSNYFRPYSQAELRGQLMREFGHGFDVSGTGHYLVIHPVGQRDKWARWFEELYRSMTHYFTARGFRLQNPKFPLVAVVFPTQRDFIRHANQQGDRLPPNVLGYYSRMSNRILQYDMSGGRLDETNVLETAETIIHEASHQTAFNTGIHNRYVDNPQWLVEGLGTMFEARGVWNSRKYTRLEDRVNEDRLRRYRVHFAGGQKRGTLASMVSSDRFFHADMDAAYAYAWALTFYLAERETAKLSRYIKLAAARPPFQDYSSPERLRDFTQVFGTNLAMLEVRVERFITSLK